MMKIPSVFCGAMKLGVRPLLLVAGAATATAGVYYLLSSRCADRQPRTVDCASQTEPEEPVQRLQSTFPLVEPSGYISDLDRAQAELVIEENVQLQADAQDSEEVIIYTCPTQFVEQQNCSKELHRSFWTLRFSYIRWHYQDKEKFCVRRHYVQLMQGAVTQSWWIFTKDFFKTSSKCPIWFASEAEVTLAERWEGHLTRVASCTFTEHTTPKISSGVLVSEVFRTYQALVIAHDEWRAVTNSGTEVVPCEPEPKPSPSAWPQPGPAPAGQSTPEGTGDAADVVAREVPALHAYAVVKRIENMSLKLEAVRLAFTTILNDPEGQEYISSIGRAILGDLATLNERDLIIFQHLYDRLLELALDPSLRGGIEVELAQIGIRHFNFIDIVYEVVMFGIRAGVRPPICPVPGGFLHHLLAMISSFSATSKPSSPNAEQYLLLVQKALMCVLEEIFSMEVSVYKSTESVSSAVWDIFEDHVNELLDSLEDL